MHGGGPGTDARGRGEGISRGIKREEDRGGRQRMMERFVGIDVGELDM